MTDFVIGPNLAAALAQSLAAAQGLAMLITDSLGPVPAKELADAINAGGTVRVVVSLPTAQVQVIAERDGDPRVLFDAQVRPTTLERVKSGETH